MLKIDRISKNFYDNNNRKIKQINLTEKNEIIQKYITEYGKSWEKRITETYLEEEEYSINEPPKYTRLKNPYYSCELTIFNSKEEISREISLNKVGDTLDVKFYTYNKNDDLTLVETLKGSNSDTIQTKSILYEYDDNSNITSEKIFENEEGELRLNYHNRLTNLAPSLLLSKGSILLAEDTTVMVMLEKFSVMKDFSSSYNEKKSLNFMITMIIYYQELILNGLGKTLVR